MAFSIQAWNISPNRRWFVRLSTSGSGILAEIFDDAADANSRTNRQAYGTSSGFGANLAVELTNEPGAQWPVIRFQEAYDWHMRVSGAAEDPDQVLRVKEFVEIDEIAHPLYRSRALIASRSEGEIDFHTHARHLRTIRLGIHLPEAAEGSIIRLNSSRRGVAERGQVEGLILSGEVNSLTNSLELVTFKPVKR